MSSVANSGARGDGQQFKGLETLPNASVAADRR